jgi:hypothetical protein
MTISWAKLSLLRIMHMGPTLPPGYGHLKESEQEGGGKKKKAEVQLFEF